jgi:lycopene cyclase domain-containing protein
MTSLTYLQFHIAFLIPAVMLMIATAFVSRAQLPDAVPQLGSGRTYWIGVAIITVVALVYTTPWDNYLIARGVWWYGDGSTVATIGYAPVGEYLFILVQPWLTALWLSHLSLPGSWPDTGRALRWRPRLAALGAATLVGLVGWRLLGTSATFYLGAILAWAAPVLALQWGVGAPQLWARKRLVTIGVAVPTTYLCVADRIAIELGIWVLAEEYTTGLTVAGLPVEEALFFLVTNIFVVQGLVLYRWVLDRRADSSVATLRLRAPDDEPGSA